MVRMAKILSEETAGSLDFYNLLFLDYMAGIFLMKHVRSVLLLCLSSELMSTLDEY